jgi:histidinol-phosphatase
MMNDGEMTSGVVSNAEITDFLGFALEIVAETRALILGYSSRGFNVETKSDDSPVTNADREAELLIRRRVGARFPEHGVIGEEFPCSNEKADFQWVTDPIDGTMNFLNGIPTYATILGLHFQGFPLVGIVDHPAMNLCYSAAFGLSAFCNGKRISIVDDADGLSPGKCVVAMSGRPNFNRVNEATLFDRFITSYPNIRLYADCFSHTRAIHGQVGACVSFAQREWDIAATEVLINEAGGKFIELAKSAPKPGVTYRSAVFGKPTVVEDLLKHFFRVL